MTTIAHHDPNEYVFAFRFIVAVLAAVPVVRWWRPWRRNGANR